MTHSARDFMQAEFARHPKGNKAFRRTGVITGHHWIAMDSEKTRRLTDQEMADEGWVPVQTMEKDIPVPMVQEPYDLMMFRNQHGMREDWHEPDEQGIGARIIGTHLDNDMGSTTRHEGKEHGEFNIVLTMEIGATETRDVAVVNLATLLSWAAQYGEAQR